MLKDHQKFMRVYLEVEHQKEKNEMLIFLKKKTEAEHSNKITAIK